MSQTRDVLQTGKRTCVYHSNSTSVRCRLQTCISACSNLSLRIFE